MENVVETDISKEEVTTTRETTSVIVSYDAYPKKDSYVLIVGMKNKETGAIDVVNAYVAEEATALWNKLIYGKENI